ncbi:MAG: hypothetical protein ACLP9K_09520 [Nitrososphaerales archaeon]
MRVELDLNDMSWITHDLLTAVQAVRELSKQVGELLDLAGEIRNESLDKKARSIDHIVIELNHSAMSVAANVGVQGITHLMEDRERKALFHDGDLTKGP